MKKILTVFLMIFCLCLIGCKEEDKSVKISFLSSINKIIITEYDVNSGEVMHSVIVENENQISYICNNLKSLSLKKFTDTNKPTSTKYDFNFFNEQNDKEIISISAHNWVDYNGSFHSIEEGEIDFNYLNSLFEHPYTWYKEEIGHIRNYICGCPSEEGTSPHIDNDEDGCCDECGFITSNDVTTLEVEIVEVEECLYEKISDDYSIEFKQSYYVIDNYGDYLLFYTSITKKEIEPLDEKGGKKMFEDKVIICNARVVIGTRDLIPVEYKYYESENKIKFNSINLEDGSYPAVKVAYCFDMVEVPKDIYNKLIK